MHALQIEICLNRPMIGAEPTNRWQLLQTFKLEVHRFHLHLFSVWWSEVETIETSTRSIGVRRIVQIRVSIHVPRVGGFFSSSSLNPQINNTQWNITCFLQLQTHSFAYSPLHQSCSHFFLTQIEITAEQNHAMTGCILHLLKAQFQLLHTLFTGPLFCSTLVMRSHQIHFHSIFVLRLKTHARIEMHLHTLPSTTKTSSYMHNQ